MEPSLMEILCRVHRCRTLRTSVIIRSHVVAVSLEWKNALTFPRGRIEAQATSSVFCCVLSFLYWALEDLHEKPACWLQCFLGAIIYEHSYQIKGKHGSVVRNIHTNAYDVRKGKMGFSARCTLKRVLFWEIKSVCFLFYKSDWRSGKNKQRKQTETQTFLMNGKNGKKKERSSTTMELFKVYQTAPLFPFFYLP